MKKSALPEKERARRILDILGRRYPHPKTLLHFNSPFQLLVAVILSAQTTDAQVNRITDRLFQVCRGPEDCLRLGQAGLEEYIQGCGLYHNKARHILAACQKLLEDYDGQVPADRRALLSLPGVGKKSSAVILANAFGVPALAVDTHVFRVSHRLGLAKAPTPEATERELCQMIPQEQWADAHHWLIYHGRNTCRARNPECGRCPVAELCPAAEMGVPVPAAGSGKKSATASRRSAERGE